MEGDAQFFSEDAEMHRLLFGATGQQGRRLAACGEGSSGFSAHNVEVILRRCRQIIHVIELFEFRNGDVRTTVCHQPNHALRIASAEAESLHEEPVSRDECFLRARLEVQGSPPPSFVGIVVHVVVNQRRGVDQFEGQRKGHDVVPIHAARGIV